MPGLLSKERIIAQPGFNRWLVPPASVAIHLCIGSVYAWSIFNPPLTKVYGVAASSADDWTLKQVVWRCPPAIWESKRKRSLGFLKSQGSEASM